jgi:hypothetical protein
MTEQELLKLIRKDGQSLVAAAYRLGRKDANLELLKEIEKIQNGLGKVSNGYRD